MQETLLMQPRLTSTNYEVYLAKKKERRSDHTFNKVLEKPLLKQLLTQIYIGEISIHENEGQFCHHICISRNKKRPLLELMNAQVITHVHEKVEANSPKLHHHQSISQCCHEHLTDLTIRLKHFKQTQYIYNPSIQQQFNPAILSLCRPKP